MKQILIVNQKGGAGKTTWAFWLILLFKKAKKRVAIRDLDIQKDLTALCKHFQVPFSDVEDADFLIIDTPPKITHEQIIELARTSDRILIPVVPHVLGFERSLKILEFLQDQKKKVAIILNLYNSRRQSQIDIVEFFRKKSNELQVPIFILRNTG